MFEFKKYRYPILIIQMMMKGCESKNVGKSRYQIVNNWSPSDYSKD